MNTTDVLDGFAALLRADVETLERRDLDELVAASARLRSWHDSFDLRCARRAHQLQRTGSSSGAEAMFGRSGNRSSKEGATITRRAEVGEQLPAFGHGLAEGEVSAGHLDALANTRGRLDDDTRARFDEHQDELLEAATNERVDVFARRCRELTARLAAPKHDADELDSQRSRANVKRWVDKITGMGHTHLELDPVRDATLWNAVNAALARVVQRDGTARTPWQQMQVNAFVEAVRGGVICDPTDGGAATTEPAPTDRAIGDAAVRRAELRLPEITVLVDLQVLVNGMHTAGICETEDGVALPVSTVRRLCCDAEIIPAVLDTDGGLLELGRSARTVNRAQRRALRAMHRTCAHPDCTVVFSACKIHHVRWWVRDRGPTDIDNLLPLCERHHHLVHEGRWGLTMTPDRIATWTRPDGVVEHSGCTIDRRSGTSPDSRGDLVPATAANSGDRRPRDRPMLS